MYLYVYKYVGYHKCNWIIRTTDHIPKAKKKKKVFDIILEMIFSSSSLEYVTCKYSFSYQVTMIAIWNKDWSRISILF